jgi:2,3-bisphosphoglycerate-independent phosphoglycerate mutase
MYKGLARLLGMKVFGSGPSFSDELKILKNIYGSYDFIFLHFKKTDAAGEDGDFDRKVSAIEEFDAGMPGVLSMQPAVIAVTGDHSTPALLKGHSWHSVPFMLSSPWCRPSRAAKFGESECARGNLGIFPAEAIMTLLMAHAQRLTKYGA